MGDNKHKVLFFGISLALRYRKSLSLACSADSRFRRNNKGLSAMESFAVIRGGAQE